MRTWHGERPFPTRGAGWRGTAGAGRSRRGTHRLRRRSAQPAGQRYRTAAATARRSAAGRGDRRESPGHPGSSPSAHLPRPGPGVQSVRAAVPARPVVRCAAGNRRVAGTVRGRPDLDAAATAGGGVPQRQDPGRRRRGVHTAADRRPGDQGQRGGRAVQRRSGGPAQARRADPGDPAQAAVRPVQGPVGAVLPRHRPGGVRRRPAGGDRAVPVRLVHALLDGQVDAIDNLPQTKIDMVRAIGANVLISETGSWTPFTMRVDAEPFRDVRVRRAMRLIVDRDQMVAQALNGQGRIANDLYAPFDIAYAKDLPQRQQDLPQARSLLKQAGHEGLRIELVTSSGIGAGAVEAARLFGKQAQGAGVDTQVHEVDGGVFYGQNYLRWPFALDYWFTRSYLPQVFQGSQPDSPYNECHWNDARFIELIHQACGELDAARRIELLREAQKIEYDSGGYLVWGFKNQVDAYSAKVTGFVPDRNLPLSSFQFRTVSFT